MVVIANEAAGVVGDERDSNLVSIVQFREVASEYALKLEFRMLSFSFNSLTV